MRLIPLIFVALVLAGPAHAQKQDGAEQNPESLLSALGLAPDPERLRAAIAAAEAHPLGSMQNPVRVGGPRGERAYIARLRCADSSSPRVGQRANVGVGVFGTIIDVYPLDCGSAAPGRVSLAMDMYHSEHAEDRPPPGFTIVPR
jgi:hypothetical protein